ncbi:LOW QUALITY PROTEIN: complement C1r subcomponent-like protein [Ctenodactylus gundi]
MPGRYQNLSPHCTATATPGGSVPSGPPETDPWEAAAAGDSSQPHLLLHAGSSGKDKKPLLLLMPRKEAAHRGSLVVVKTLSTFLGDVVDFKTSRRVQMVGSQRGALSLEKLPRTSCAGKMFWLLLWGILQACPTHGSVLLAQQQPQQLRSPGYPAPYPRGHKSSTDIVAPEGLAVRLVFRDFDLKPSPGCEEDSVTISGSGADPSRLCGHQGSPLGSPPGLREFVSSGRSLRVTFRTHTSSKDKTKHLSKGFLALYQAVGEYPQGERRREGTSCPSHDPESGRVYRPIVRQLREAKVDMTPHIYDTRATALLDPADYRSPTAASHQPTSEASEGSAATLTPGATPCTRKSYCQEPYYQAVPVGTLSCPAQGTWKDRQAQEDAPRCVPVCGQPVTPMTLQSPGSSRAQPGSFPWQAFTSIHGRAGGALLGDRWVLTAAHTIHPKDSMSLRVNRSVDVFLGHTHIDEMLKLGNHPVRRVVVHPSYRQHEPHNFDGDIALLELERRVPLGPSLLPICLPDTDSGSLYLPGVWGHVSGFGIQMGWLTTELKQSRLAVAAREDCEAWLQKLQRPEVFSKNMFCVGNETQPSPVCQGDSGSVYVVWDDQARRWVATGIVSWGIGCGKGYGFYTKVLSYVDWIQGVMDGRN